MMVIADARPFCKMSVVMHGQKVLKVHVGELEARYVVWFPCIFLGIFLIISGIGISVYPDNDIGHFPLPFQSFLISFAELP